MEFAKEFVLGLLELQKTDPNKVGEFLKCLSDKQLIEFGEAMKSIANDIPTEYHNDELKNNLATIDENKAMLEEKIVDDEIKEMMYDVELDALAQERHAAFMGLKNEIRKKLLENPDSPEAKLVANHIIKVEKEHNHFNEAEWAEVLYILNPDDSSISLKPAVEETQPIEDIKPSEEKEKTNKSPYSRPPLTRNQIFLKLDKLKFKPDELTHFMSTKGMTREEYCIAVPMLFSMYEGTKEYKTNKQLRDQVLEQKKIHYDIVASYNEIFKKQKAEQEEAKAKAMQSLEELLEKLKEQLMLQPNNEDIKKAIREIIAMEKKNNIYDEEYWEDILHLL